MRLGLWATGVAAALMINATGCTAPGTPSVGTPSVDTSGVATPPDTVVEVRQMHLEVPAGYRVQTLEFTDATHGIAELIAEKPVVRGELSLYASMLRVSADGGRSWQPIDDPRQPSPSPQLYIVDSQTVALLAEPQGWFLSQDGGRSFQARSLDSVAELNGLFDRPYGVDCADTCVVRHRESGRTMPVRQPSLPGRLTAAAGTAAAVWAASVQGATVHTALSQDGGLTWGRTEVPEHPRGLPDMVELMASKDGHDTWLVGYVATPAASLGRSLPMRRKSLGVPLLWRWSGGTWVPKGTVGAPEASSSPFSVAAIGGGFMAVRGPSGLAIVDEGWRYVDLLPRPEWVKALADGTVFASAESNRAYYLGTLTDAGVRWVHLRS